MDAELVLRTKVCTKCGHEKLLDEFHKNRSKKDGHASCCKACGRHDKKAYYQTNKENKKRYRHTYYLTPEGFTTKVWGSLNKRTINGSAPQWSCESDRRYLEVGVELRLTRQQFYDFVVANMEVIQAIRAAGGVPSIDRIGPSIHYELGNIRFISWSENSHNAAVETNRKRRRAKLAMER